MGVNDTSMIVIDDSRVMLQIVALLTEDSIGVIYDHNMFIVQVTKLKFKKSFTSVIYKCL